MTDEEKKQYEIARAGIARLMGDASEAEKWEERVRQTRSAEHRDAPDLTEQDEAVNCEYCNDTYVILDGDNEYPCYLCYDFEAEADASISRHAKN